MKKWIVAFVFVACCLHAGAQGTLRLSGYVSDAETGERLAAATVFAHEMEKGTICNNYGFFTLHVTPGVHTVRVRYLGYHEQELKLNLKADTLVNIELRSNNLIDEIEVRATGKENFLHTTQMGVHRMDAKAVQCIPVVFGESDVLKAIQTLPGVSFSTEGSTGMGVRGGRPDNTLILLDGVPVYNVNHLWGFMSLFNNDAISDATLYKGSLPARYGGRLSSVLDIGMKEGNLKSKGGSFSISPIAGSLTLEGPLVEDKVSYTISARKTWLDVLMKGYQHFENQSGGMPMYGFWDLNAKTNWVVNANNRLFLSFYTGRDAYELTDGDEQFDKSYMKFSYNWQNLTSVLRWNHVFSPNLFSNFSVYNSRFKQQYQNWFKKDKSEAVMGQNNLNDWSHTADFDWFLPNNARVRFGYLLSSQQFRPDQISYRFDSLSYVFNKDMTTRNWIAEGYVEVENSLSDRLNFNVGIRPGLMRTNGTNYLNLQPRAAINYRATEYFSTKLSYARMAQYLHQLQNSTLGIPTDMWVSATPQIRPGASNQLSAGFFVRPAKGYQFSVELYTARMQHIINTKNGAFALKNSNETWETVVAKGRGRSNGLELMAEKTNGALTWNINYTLSKTDWQFNDLNDKQWFPSNYDRRHLLNVYAHYRLNEKKKNEKIIKRSFSAHFKYASGNHITLAEQAYAGIAFPMMELPDESDAWFEQRALVGQINNYQMPNFHHLNVSYTVDRVRPDRTTFSWIFSVYNVYNRHNPWYYYKKGTEMKQITLFPIIPTVTFRYTF